MKSIVFGIVVLLALQGCSYIDKRIDELAFTTLSINSCSSSFHPYNEKQCKKDKETLNKILGKGGLEAANTRRQLIAFPVLYWPVTIAGVAGIYELSK